MSNPRGAARPGRRWRDLIGAGLLVASLLGGGGGALAQTPPKLAQSPVDGPPTVSIGTNTATPEFPSGVTFNLTADSPDEIDNVELRYHPAYIDTLSVEFPAVQPGDSVNVSQKVDLRDGSLPPGIDLDYYWRITEKDGDVVNTAPQAVTWLDTRFNWTTIESPLVSVHAYNDNPAFNQQILKVAEDTIQQLSQRYNVQMDHPIRIWVYNSDADFSSQLAPNSEPWVAGAAYPWYGLISAILPPNDMQEVMRVVPHEVSHQVLYQATKNPFNSPPSWLDEGLATYTQGNGKEALWQRVAAAADAGKLDHLEALNGQFPYDAQAAMLSYGESLSVVQYILDTYGEEGMAKLIATFKNGVSYDEAVQQGLGITFDQLDADWRAAAGDLARKQLAGTTRGTDDQLGGWIGGGGSLLMGAAAIMTIVVGARAWGRYRKLANDPDIDDPEDHADRDQGQDHNASDDWRGPRRLAPAYAAVRR